MYAGLQGSQQLNPALTTIVFSAGDISLVSDHELWSWSAL